MPTRPIYSRVSAFRSPIKLINWPIFGNDYYVNVLELAPVERKSSYDRAKEFTLNYVYYLQTDFPHIFTYNGYPVRIM